MALGAGNSQFVAKYSGVGVAQWANELTGASIADIACNASRVVVTGGFFSSINLGGTTYTTTGLFDGFVICLDNLGAFQWGQTFGTSNADYAKGVAFRNNKIILTGTYNGNLVWGNTALSSLGNDDIFLMEYDLAGNKEWIKGFNGTGGDNVMAVKSDIMGNIYLLGSGNRLWLGNQAILTPYLNAFVAKFDPTGDCIWAKSFSSTNTINATGLSTTIVNGFTKLCFSGYFSGTNVPFGHTKLTSGSTNMFLATLTEN